MLKYNDKLQLHTALTFHTRNSDKIKKTFATALDVTSVHVQTPSPRLPSGIGSGMGTGKGNAVADAVVGSIHKQLKEQ